MQSALENKIANPNFIAPFLGHKVKGTDFHYSNHDLEELRAKFKESLPYLIPETTGQLKSELEETKTTTKTLEQENAKLQKEIDAMPHKIKEELKKMFPEMLRELTSKI